MSVAMEGDLLNKVQQPLGGESILDAHSKTRSLVEDKQMYAASPGAHSPTHQVDSGFVLNLGTRGASEPSECLQSGYDGLRLHYPKLGLRVQLRWHAWSFPLNYNVEEDKVTARYCTADRRAEVKRLAGVASSLNSCLW